MTSPLTPPALPRTWSWGCPTHRGTGQPHPRGPVTKALDLETGCGIQALLISPHATHVTATDTNIGALAFARFNAALNGVTNVDFIEGDLFEPVGRNRFQLVVANPPFVISPGSTTCTGTAGGRGTS